MGVVPSEQSVRGDWSVNESTDRRIRALMGVGKPLLTALLAKNLYYNLVEVTGLEPA